MILDPSRDGCTIWEGNKVQYIKGSPKECCETILKSITQAYENPETKEIERFQVKLYFGLDVAGIGRMYADYFKYMGIEFYEIKPGIII